jgi:HK97 family phage prohead protease
VPPATVTTGLERRVVPMELRVRRQAGGTPHLVGHAAVFNRQSVDLGGWVELIKPGAFRRALETSDTRALWNHDSNLVLGRRKPGGQTNTLQLEEDQVGLRVDIDPPRSATYYIESVERRDVDAMSFSFWVDDSKVTWETLEDGTLLRTIHADGISELGDVSPVTYPAYPDTDVALRAAERIRRRGDAPVARRAGRSPEVVRLELERMKLQLDMDSLDFNARLAAARGPAPRVKRKRAAPPLPSREEWRLARERAGAYGIKTAQAEAAHAVAFFLAGAGVRSIRLYWKRLWDGRVELEGGCCRARRPGRLTGAELSAAEAWCLLQGWPIGVAEERGFESDREEVLEWLMREGRLVDRGRCIVEAQAVLSRHYPAVTGLAHVLLDRIRMRGREAEAVILEHLDPRTRLRIRKLVTAAR